MNKSYGVITNNLKEFSTRNKEIRRFKCSFFENIDEFSISGDTFPLLYAVPESIDMDRYANFYSFRIYVIDLLVNGDEIAILNDCSSIIRDLVVWLKESDNGLSLQEIPRAVPINNFLMDKTLGFYIDVSIEATVNSTECSIPFIDQDGMDQIICDYTPAIRYLTPDTLSQASSFVSLSQSVSNNIESIEGLSQSIDELGIQNLNKILHNGNTSSIGFDIYTNGIPTVGMGNNYIYVEDNINANYGVYLEVDGTQSQIGFFGSNFNQQLLPSNDLNGSVINNLPNRSGEIALIQDINGLSSSISSEITDINNNINGLTQSLLFSDDIVVNLSNNKTLGKYTNGQTIPAVGKTFEQVLRDIAIEYIYPSFNSFLVLNQSNILEVGSSLTGSRTFNWNISNNSGIVNDVDIFDNTTNSLLLNTINDGTQLVNINNNLLQNDGDTQSWKIIAINISPTGNINSSNFVVTARYKIFYGPVATTPTSSNDIRNLPSNIFKNVGSNVFDMTTGTTYNKFVIALPPSKIITSVIDTGNLNLNITNDYILSTLSVLDANGTSRLYNIYQLTLGSPYSVSTTHRITTN